ncbi:chloride channel protein [Hyphomicrobium sp. B1]|uniref:chloride channel protein n=1 Tax=unclassified Hyphomicrobium TaxID=2619925 RepID=UPI003918E82E
MRLIEIDRSRGDFTANPRVLWIAAIAVVVATISVGAGVGLLALIRLCTNIAYFGEWSFAARTIGELHLGFISIFIPVAGALLIGLMARYGSEKIRGHGIPEALEAILLGRSRLSPKVAILKPISSAISIGTGGPFGAEGPIIMTGGALGSIIAQMLPVSDAERKTLLVAGAAAGMTTVFGTPIAAVMLAVELLLFEWAPRSFIPVAVAATVSAVERSYLHMPSPLFPFSGDVQISLMGLITWVAVGAIAGLLSGVLTKLVYTTEDLFSKLPIHWMWWPMIGGICVGIGGLIDPRALSVGYDNIDHLLKGDLSTMSALSLLLVKMTIWGIALGSGTSGGVLAPLLIIGGAMGMALTAILPIASAGFWPLLAMAATMGGTMRIPLTATFFAVEVTGAIDCFLPVLAACTAAYTVAILMMRRSILTERLARRGHHILCEYHVQTFALTRVEDVMTRSVQTVPASMTLRDAASFLIDPDTIHPTFPVVDEDRRVLGVLDPPSVMKWRRKRHPRTAQLHNLLQAEKPVIAHPDEHLEAVAERMNSANVAHVPVVNRNTGRLVGYLCWKDIVSVQAGPSKEEPRRAFFRLRRHQR